MCFETGDHGAVLVLSQRRYEQPADTHNDANRLQDCSQLATEPSKHQMFRNHSHPVDLFLRSPFDSLFLILTTS